MWGLVFVAFVSALTLCACACACVCVCVWERERELQVGVTVGVLAKKSEVTRYGASQLSFEIFCRDILAKNCY